jgi:hypothetical protein
LDELAGQHDQLSLSEDEIVEGFDPNNLFTTHMSLIGYSSYFINTEQFKEGSGDNLNLPERNYPAPMRDINNKVEKQQIKIPFH